MIRVDFLRNHPELGHTVARWIFDEWDHVTVRNLEAEELLVQSRLHNDRVPLALVALEGEACVGTVSLYETDLGSRPDLSPWLASLYVHPDHRNRGVGRALVAEVIVVARGLGIGRLYLHTETASAYYQRMGWRFLFGTRNDRNEETEVFCLDLGP